MKDFTKDDRYMGIAKIWSENSHSRKRKVGAILVKDQTIISDGYNGTPKGFDNNCEFEDSKLDLITRPEVLHAEANAITKMAKSTQSSIGATLYVTLSPCVECAKLIIQSGIIRVVYKERYRDERGLALLEKAKIEIEELKNNLE